MKLISFPSLLSNGFSALFRGNEPIEFAIDSTPGLTSGRDGVLRGWAMHTSGPVQLRLLLGDRELHRWQADLPRPDLFLHFANNPYSARCGFKISFPETVFDTLRSIPSGELVLVASAGALSEQIWAWENGGATSTPGNAEALLQNALREYFAHVAFSAEERTENREQLSSAV